MADKYVWSGAAGAGTGADWANAFTTLSAALAAGAAGDRFFVAHDHSTSTASAVALASPGTPANPCQIVCVNRAGSVPPVTADLATTAVIATTGANAITTTGSAYWYGITLSGGSGATNVGVTVGATSGAFNVMENCKLIKLGTTASATTAIDLNSSAGGGRMVLRNTTVQFGATGDAMRSRGTLEWLDTQNLLQGAIVPNKLIAAGAINAAMHFEGCDLSGITTTLVGDMTGYRRVTFKDCKLAAAVTIVETMAPTAGVQEVYVSRSHNSANNYRSEVYRLGGSQTIETTRIRTNGAQDGTQALSWKIATNANVAFLAPFRTTPIIVRNSLTGTLMDMTVHGIVDAAALPRTDEIWAEVEYLGETNSPRGRFANNARNLLGTGAALAASAERWDSAAAARANNTVYSVGDVIRVSSNPGQLFFCTTSGTSASSLPSAYAGTVDGVAVTDGTAVFRGGQRFAMVVQFTPRLSGVCYVTIRAAKTSTTYYVDPQPSLAAASVEPVEA